MHPAAGALPGRSRASLQEETAARLPMVLAESLLVRRALVLLP